MDAGLAPAPESQPRAAEAAGFATAQVGLALPGELVDGIVARIVQEVVGQLRTGLADRWSPWIDLAGLAEYTGWGQGTVEKLSAAKQLPGLVKHGGKVMIHLPTFDEGLLREHQVGPRSLPVMRRR